MFACFSYHENAISPSRQPSSALLSDHIDNLDKTRDERTSSIMHSAPTFAVIMLLYLKHETPRLASSFPLFSSFAFSCSHRDYLSHSCLVRYEAFFIKRSFLYKIVFLVFLFLFLFLFFYFFYFTTGNMLCLRAPRPDLLDIRSISGARKLRCHCAVP